MLMRKGQPVMSIPHLYLFNNQYNVNYEKEEMGLEVGSLTLLQSSARYYHPYKEVFKLLSQA